MAFQPIFGHLFSDISVRAMALVAMIIFEVGSVVCATAKSSAALIVGRLIAGAGGAGLYVGTLTMITYIVPISKRPLYLSLITSMFGVASVAGPLLGGVFTDSTALTWRFCFWINLRKDNIRERGSWADVTAAIGFVAFVLIGLNFKDQQKLADGSRVSFGEEFKKLDLGGVALLMSAFVCFILALQWGGVKYPWSNSRVWGCIVGFGLLSMTFLVLQVFLGSKWVSSLYPLGRN